MFQATNQPNISGRFLSTRLGVKILRASSIHGYQLQTWEEDVFHQRSRCDHHVNNRGQHAFSIIFPFSLWLFVAVRHGKIHHAIKFGSHHLFLWVIEKPWRTVSHNQRLPLLTTVNFAITKARLVHPKAASPARSVNGLFNESTTICVNGLEAPGVWTQIRRDVMGCSCHLKILSKIRVKIFSALLILHCWVNRGFLEHGGHPTAIQISWPSPRV